MLVEFLKKNFLTRKLIFELGKHRARSITDTFIDKLSLNEKIIDIGAGTANITYLLKRIGFQVKAFDIKDLSFTPQVSPTLYDGKTLPLKNRSCDVALLITVLHHTKNPVELIEEAARTSRKIVVIEDVYTNIFQKYMTYFFDSLLNLEFIDHPHSNKTDKEWRAIFQEQDLKIKHSSIKRSFIVFKQATYLLEVQS